MILSREWRRAPRIQTTGLGRQTSMQGSTDSTDDNDPDISLFSRGETWRRLRISERHLASLTRKGEIRHIKIGSRVFYTNHDLREFIIQRHTSRGGA